MKKIFLIIIVILSMLLLIDTAQAKIFNNSPFIKIREEYSGNIILRADKGIIVETCYCANGEIHTYFKWNPFTCPTKKEDFPTN